MLIKSPPIPAFMGQMALSDATCFFSFVTLVFSQLVIAVRDNNNVNMNDIRFMLIL